MQVNRVADLGEAETEPNATVADLVERRRVEIAYFVEALRSRAVLEDIGSRDYFRALLALAVNDYGVSRQALAALVFTHESNISKWIAGDTTPRLPMRRLAVGRIREILVDRLKHAERTPENDAPANLVERQPA